MSNVLFPNNKKREPYAQNSVYNKNLPVGCLYCVKQGQYKKNYKNLWVLYMHFRTHHKNELGYKEKIMKLADLIIEGTRI